MSEGRDGPDGPRSRIFRDAALAGLAALLLHGLFLLVLPAELRSNQSADFELFYQPVAEALLDGRGLVTPDGQPAMRYPPGFPAILAAQLGLVRAAGGSDALALALGTAAWVFFGVAAFHLLARALTTVSVARWATLAWLAYPPFLWLAKQPNSEMPFFFPTFLGLWAAVRSGREARAERWAMAVAWALASGVACGLAALIRPAALALAVAAFVPVLAASTLRWRRRLGLVAVAVLCQLLVLLPWEVWMHQQSGRWWPVSTGGRLSLLDGLTISIKPGREGRPAVGEDVVALMREIQEHRHQIHGPLDAVLFLADRFGEQPWAVTKLGVIKAARSWYATDSLAYERWLLLLQLPILALAAGGLWRWRRSDSSASGHAPAFWLIVATTLYFWSMAFLVLSILRYLLPAMALLLLPATAEALRWAPRSAWTPGPRRASGRRSVP